MACVANIAWNINQPMYQSINVSINLLINQPITIKKHVRKIIAKSYIPQSKFIFGVLMAYIIIQFIV